MLLTPIQKKDTRYVSEAELNNLIDENKHIYHEYFDLDYLKSILDNVCGFFDKYYFRVRFIGFDTIPERNNPARPLIYASNHSGMAFPWDAMVFGAGLLKLTDCDMRRCARGLAAPMLSQTKLMHPYLIEDFWKIVGGVDATSLNFETMMHQEESNVLIYPEGVPGIGKGFNRKYQLQRFSTSFVRMAIKYKTDVIPVSTVNGEYINPYSYNSPLVTKLVNKIGIPFLPLGLTLLLVPLQPWTFYMAFPANLTYVMGKRIKPYEMTDKPFEELTRNDFLEIADRIKDQMQEELNQAVLEYGKRPYDLKSLIKTTMQNLTKLPFSFPWGWPLIMLEHHRLARKGNYPIQMKYGFFSIFKMLFNNPRAIWFYIPIFGWIPIIFRMLYSKSSK